MNKLLVILMDDFQDIELVTFIALVQKANIFQQIDYFNPESKNVFGQFGLAQIRTKNKVNLQDYNSIFIPGGKGARRLRNDVISLEIIKHFFEKAKNVFAICDAPNALFENNILKQAFSSYPIDDLPKTTLRNENTITISDYIITARNANSAAQLAYEVIKKLASKKLADQILKHHSA
ncbi:monophosphate biosynthesis [Mesomycoplasma conjunctivae]|nr:DJ-1/PfpI family protein [Mesomycoplasma conjunctivae]VEU66266.1 monophosphate biosynthesis [Mesomycoplasma conjunctivae]